MARNGSGVYSLPANTAAVSGDPVSSSKFNTLVEDLEAVLNTARPVVKGGTGSTTAAGARTALGLAIGTNVLAYDDSLNSIAGLTTDANKMIYTTAADTYAVADLSAFARTILDDADAAAVRATIGAGTGDGSGDGDLLAANNLSDLASASTARNNLGLGALAVEAAINNGLWSGTDLAVTNGGTGASDAATARTNLGLGTMAVEAAANYAALSGAQFTGNVGIGVAATAPLHVSTSAAFNTAKFLGSGSTGGAYLGFSAGAMYLVNTDNANMLLGCNNQIRLTLTPGGDSTFSHDVNAVDFNASSDERLKENFRPFDQGLEYVLATEIVRFNRIGQEGEHIGPIAQQMELGFPEGVNTGDDEKGLKKVDLLNMLGASYDAIQKLHSRLEAIENGRS